MTRRLLALPCLFAAGLAWGYYSGMAWPVFNTAMSFLNPPPCNEGDYMG